VGSNNNSSDPIVVGFVHGPAGSVETAERKETGDLADRSRDQETSTVTCRSFHHELTGAEKPPD
jgi:hypothetical protein